MSYFKYLVGVLTASEYFWPVLVGNLRKAWKKWASISKILGQEGANMLCRDISQGGGSGCSSLWIEDVGDDPPMGRALGFFHNV